MKFNPFEHTVFMKIYFNPLDVDCKSIVGAVRKEQEFQLNIYNLPENHYGNTAPKIEECNKPEQDAYLLLARDGQCEERFLMEKTEFGWSICLSIFQEGLYFYAFSIENGFVCRSEERKGHFDFYRGQSFQLTVFKADYQTPEWFKGGVMYQIFPDRFQKKGTMPHINGRIERTWGEMPYYQPNEKGKVLNNDFFGGNFKGIEEKLPYLQSLGVTVIYLNPIFLAASNHRYDTSDYMQIDPVLGTEEDLQSLINAAKNLGMKVILDGVFNHTGDNSVYFNKYGTFDGVGAYQSKLSPYYSWYTFQRYPDKYASWWGIDILPEVNKNSNSYQEFIFGENGVLKKWLSFGIGGYRLDVADELPDFFLKKLRNSVKSSNEEAIIIGEVWEDASNKIAYSTRREYFQGEELDSVMNYPLKDAIILYMQTSDSKHLSKTVKMLVDHYPKDTLDCLMNILGTHDTARILTVLGGKQCFSKSEMANPCNTLGEAEKGVALNKLKAASLLQFTIFGVPCIYYGDENAQEGYIDPFCRQCYDWENQNEKLIEHYQKLGKIRKNYSEIFKDGDFEEIYSDRGLYVFKRCKQGKAIYVFVNRSSEKFSLQIKGTFKELLFGNTFENVLTIDRFQNGIFVKV